MRTSLSKSEFASALGMKADAVFVKKMFNIVDKDGDGRISFQVRNIKEKLFYLFASIASNNCFFRLMLLY